MNLLLFIMTLQFNFTSSNAGSRSNNLEVIEILQNHFENEENEFKEFFEDGTISFEKSDEILAIQLRDIGKTLNIFA